MARAPAATKPTATTKATVPAVTNWDAKLAEQAEATAKAEANSGGGNFISLKSGVLSYNGAPVPGNTIAVVITGAVFENSFYEGKYESENPQPPRCYAFSTVEDDLAPRPDWVDEPISEVCHGCPNNEWASAETGRGKACKNSRRLALIVAGTLNHKTDVFTAYDREALQASPLVYLKVPVTSVKAYANYVKQVAGSLRLPPHGIVTRLSVQPDANTQLRVEFEALEPVDKKLLDVVFARHDEAMASIEFPYPKPEAAPTSRGRRVAAKPAAKPAAKKAAVRGKY